MYTLNIFIGLIYDAITTISSVTWIFLVSEYPLLHCSTRRLFATILHFGLNRCRSWILISSNYFPTRTANSMWGSSGIRKIQISTKFRISFRPSIIRASSWVNLSSFAPSPWDLNDATHLGLSYYENSVIVIVLS